MAPIAPATSETVLSSTWVALSGASEITRCPAAGMAAVAAGSGEATTVRAAKARSSSSPLWA